MAIKSTSPVTKTAMKKLIYKYYDLVDNKLFKELGKIFSEKIVYYRCGKAIVGLNDLNVFYSKERKLEGKHFILDTIQENNRIVIKGIFRGINGKGENKPIKFVDIFEIDQTLLVIKRETFLAANYERTI